MLRKSALGVALLLIVGVAAGFGQGRPQPSEAEKPILEALRKLRSMPDDERARVTKELALQIRRLPAGERKVGIAGSLANLSTEGDFGKDTLQAVTDTLAESLRETPVHGRTGEPAPQYFQLAQLSKYEGMRVSLKGPEYTAAMAKVEKLEIERAKADFTLTDLDGKSWTLSALKGKVVLVNFWATWCPPCRKEMPDLQALYDRFKDKGFVVLSISDEDETKVRPYVAEHGYRYPFLLDPGRKVNELYQVDGIPKSFVYNRQGKLVAQSIDMRTQRQFLELLARAGLK
jgi:peroxiredoxin